SSWESERRIRPLICCALDVVRAEERRIGNDRRRREVVIPTADELGLQPGLTAGNLNATGEEVVQNVSVRVAARDGRVSAREKMALASGKAVEINPVGWVIAQGGINEPVDRISDATRLPESVSVEVSRALSHPRRIDLNPDVGVVVAEEVVV